jgi:hypothetical protein
LTFVKFGKSLEGIVKGGQFYTRSLGKNEEGIEFDPLVRATFRREIAASVIHQNLPHQAGGNREKVRSIMRIEGPLVD